MEGNIIKDYKIGNTSIKINDKYIKKCQGPKIIRVRADAIKR